MKTYNNPQNQQRLIVLLSVLFAINLNGQYITPSVISNGGNNQVNSFTIGEPFVNTIGSNAIITQGFHQNYIISTAVLELDQLQVLIYPNPFSNAIKINVDNLIPNLTLNIYNQNGSLVINQLLHNKNESIDLNHLISGIYYAVILEENIKIYSSKLLKK